ncbi:pirin family protein [Shewanella sp. UCD-KL12]|uniref:pirin family protein n=1 Tax=Shewanella sp. UCD-KL12 TaxID=1917163 RepID=UPI00097122C0|nr:pirin family protein [Shewanella sp. UCD-KL12]
MLDIRVSSQRGRGKFSWLDSKHSFSFADYYDANRMGFASLRVINDDTVSPGAGFDTHGHRDMEIISYVTQGEIIHKDSQGHHQRLPAGEFQLMSAGKGIYHSEFNPSQSESLKFLQIWIQPDTVGGEPSYQQKHFKQTQAIKAIVSPTGENGTLKIKQDAYLYRLSLVAQEQTRYETEPQRKLYVHLIDGELMLEGKLLKAGDGAAITNVDKLDIIAHKESGVSGLIFDMA